MRNEKADGRTMERVTGGNLKDKHQLEILNYDESIIS